VAAAAAPAKKDTKKKAKGGFAVCFIAFCILMRLHVHVYTLLFLCMHACTWESFAHSEDEGHGL
jgi:hypothetical protein